MDHLVGNAWGSADARGGRQDGAGVAADRYGRVVVSRGEAADHSNQSGNPLSTPDPVKQDQSSDVREVRNDDGRIERFFNDGRREIEFPNGLRKVMHLDGRTQIMFQNGDQKE